MKTLPLALLALTIGSAQAVPYTYIYDVFQGGYDGGEPYPTTMSAVIKITDNDGDGLISAADAIAGSLVFRRPIVTGGAFGLGYDITGITGVSLLSGDFSITGVNHLGELAIVTNTGGMAVNFDYSRTGLQRVTSTTQAPVVMMRVPDSGSTALLFGMGLFTLRRLKL